MLECHPTTGGNSGHEMQSEKRRGWKKEGRKAREGVGGYLVWVCHTHVLAGNSKFLVTLHLSETK